MSEYAVHIHKYGCYVTGSLPLDEMVRLMKFYGMKSVSPAWRHIAENTQTLLSGTKEQIRQVLNVANSLKAAA